MEVNLPKWPMTDPPIPSMRRWVKVTIAGIATAFVAGVLTAGNYVATSWWPNVTQGPYPARASTISSMPEGRLIYPGSHLTFTFTTSLSRIPLLGVVDYPHIERIAASNASREAVLQYYQRELKRLGWKMHMIPNVHAPVDWSRGRYVFVIDFDPGGSSGQDGVPGYNTTYETSFGYSTDPDPFPSAPVTTRGGQS